MMCSDSRQPVSDVLLEMLAGGQLEDEALYERVQADPALRARYERIRRDNELLGEVVALEPTSERDSFDPIEGYELLEEIHRGGQGVVHRARQKSADRIVAVKTLLRGVFATEAQQHRFEREVRLAARLKHPSIVTVHESGRTALGAHYIVLEYIEGEPVDKYAGRLRECGDVRGIARLFGRICDAVWYAHQRGVLHRDLKPGNIVVDARGVPHILDFGIARAFGDDTLAEPIATRTGEFVGTLAYASPEQVASDAELIDVRSDVYAIGVMMFEALTGQRPVRTTGGLAEIIVRITTEPPPAARALNRAIDEDLNTIVMTALAKDPRERYQGAGELKQDIDSWLLGGAISARAHDFWYVARKALVRHRVSVAIGSTFVVLILVFAIVTSSLAISLKRENRTLSNTVTALSSSLRSIDRETSTAHVSTLTGFLAELVSNIRERVGDRSDIESAVLEATGIAYLDDEQKYDEAERSLLAAYRLRKEMLTAPDPALASVLQDLGRLRFKQHRFEEAEDFYRQALEMRLALYGTEHKDVARTMHHLAYTLQELGQLDEAEKYWNEALRIRRDVLEPGDIDIGNTLTGLGLIQSARGDHEGAVRSFREALDLVLADPAYGPDSLPAGRVHHNLGVALRDLGQFDEAEAALKEALRIKLIRERDTTRLAMTRVELGRLFLMKGETAEAEAQANEAQRIVSRIGSSDDESDEPSLLLAEIRLAQGRAEEALRYVTRAQENAQSGTTPWEQAVVLSVAARVEAALGHQEAAIDLAERADRTLSGQKPDSDITVRGNIKTLVLLYEAAGRSVDAAAARARVSGGASSAAADGEKSER